MEVREQGYGANQGLKLSLSPCEPSSPHAPIPLRLQSVSVPVRYVLIVICLGVEGQNILLGVHHPLE